MFEDLWDESDLELTVNRLRVHVLTLKKNGKLYELFRLYGDLARALALSGDHHSAQDSLNDAEFLVVEHQWRGQGAEAWCFLFRAEVLHLFGHAKHAQRNLEKARTLVRLTRVVDDELEQRLKDLESGLELV